MIKPGQHIVVVGEFYDAKITRRSDEHAPYCVQIREKRPHSLSVPQDFANLGDASIYAADIAFGVGM